MHPAIRNLKKVIRVLRGKTAFNFIPGVGQKFTAMPRLADGLRPPLCALSVTDDEILFSAAISRPEKGCLNYRPIHDLCRPADDVLKYGNPAIAAVAEDLAKTMLRWADNQIRYPRPLPQPVWPQLLIAESFDGESWRIAEYESQPEEVSAEIMAGRAYEDFTPVLGARYWNPSRVLARPENPAAHILGKHKMLSADLLARVAAVSKGAEDAGLGDLVDQLINEMRKEIPFSARWTDNELAAALTRANDRLPPRDGLEWMNVVAENKEAVLAAMAALLRPSVVEACDEDNLLAAAYNPAEPLVVNYRSEVQIVKTESLVNLPPFYSGTVVHRDALAAPAAQPTSIEDDMEPVRSVVHAPVADVVSAE